MKILATISAIALWLLAVIIILSIASLLSTLSKVLKLAVLERWSDRLCAEFYQVLLPVTGIESEE